MNIEIDPIAAIISCLALIVSIGTAYSVFIYNKRKYILDAYFYKEKSFIDLEKEIYKNPSVLAFHGISEKDLQEYNITIEEFCYLLASFTLVCLEHRAFNTSEEKIILTEYRTNMLKCESTRRAWPLIKRMMSSSPCTSKIDKVIAEIEASLEGKAIHTIITTNESS